MGKIRFEVNKGTLGAEPEISFLKNDTTMAKFSIAVNNYMKDKKTGEWEQIGETSWINAVAFGYPAEQIEAMELEKGQNVFAKGTLEQNTYEDKEGYEVTDWNFKVDTLLPIPKIFIDDEDEDEDDRPRRKKGNRKGGSRRKSGKKKSSAKSRLKKREKKTGSKNGTLSQAEKIMKQLGK